MSFTREQSGSITMKGVLDALRSIDKKEIEVGWFASAKYDDSTPVAYVMSVQEYGNIPRNIPPRPFFMPTIVNKEKEWFDLATNYSKAILSGRYTVDNAMNGIGSTIEDDVRESINSVTEPPLKEKTKQHRRRMGITQDHPLRRTGYAISTLTYVVS